MPERVMQAEDPAALTAERCRAGGPVHGPGLDEDLGARLATVAGAVAALSRKVEAVQRPAVTRAQRREALEQARDFITDLGRAVGVRERIEAEVAVARYLTGE